MSTDHVYFYSFMNSSIILLFSYLPAFFSHFIFFFFFNDPPTPEIYPLSLHDALPIFVGIDRSVEALEELLFGPPLPLTHQRRGREDQRAPGEPADGELLVDDARLDRLPEAHLIGEDRAAAHVAQDALGHVDLVRRSEEHTSELQSQSNLVCRLLLEKKKKKI